MMVENSSLSLTLFNTFKTILVRMTAVKMKVFVVLPALVLLALCRFKPPLDLHFLPQSLQIISADCAYTQYKNK